MSKIKQGCMSKIKQVVIDVKGLVERKCQRTIKGEFQRSITSSVREANYIQYVSNHNPCHKEIMCNFTDRNPLLWVIKALFMCIKLLVYVEYFLCKWSYG